MKINLHGSTEGSSGYAVHTKGLLTALQKAGVDVSLNGEHKNAPNITISLPYAWSQLSSKNNTIGFCVFEGSKLHLSWKYCIEKPHVKQVWVPSQHVKEACIEAGVTKPIHIIPHGVDTNLFNPNVEPVEKSDKFTFLFVGGWSQGERDRKGLDIALRAFTEEFGKDENVRFVAKINTVYNAPNYNVGDEIRKLKLRPKEERGEILVLTQGYKYEDMPKIYRMADVFVLPTKAEGFGLVALEAMGCGIPVITSNYGGQLDFVDNNNGWLLVDGRMIPATDNQFFYEESQWYLPSVDELRKVMRHAYNNRNEVREKGIKARKTAESFTWDNSARLAIKALEYKNP